MYTDLFSPLFTERLAHKFYITRKTAVQELQKHISNKETLATDIPVIIHTLIQDFLYNNNPNARDGGLMGLEAIAIALGPDVAPYLDILVPPILSCVTDPDYRVRYYASEIIYNIAKVTKGEVLRFFNSIFDALCKLAADQNQSVIYGFNLLDRRIKGIVSALSTTYVSPHQRAYNPAFSLRHFIPVLTQRIYARNSSTRQYVMTWVIVLNSTSNLELISFVPDFLDGLLDCLSDPSDDVRTATSGCLGEFLQEIKQAAATPKKEPINEKKNCMTRKGGIVRYDRIVEVLVQRLSTDEEVILKTALQWINEFIAIAKAVVIKFKPLIIANIRSCLAHPTSIIRETAIEIRWNLHRFGFKVSPVSKDEEKQTVETQRKRNGNVAEDPVQTDSDNGAHAVSTAKPRIRTVRRNWFDPHSENDLENLVKDPDFHLVKLEDTNGQMTVFTPALHPEIAKDVKRERWICITSSESDLADFIDWDDVRVVDGDNGDDIRVKVHPDHRDKIMRQLQRIGRYYWIDIICTQSGISRWVADRIHAYCKSCMTLPPSTYRNWRHELLRNPKLRLLKVEHGENQIDQHRREIKSLTVVAPALDLEILEDAKQRGWHCLSHLWGNPAEWIVWNDSGVVDGVTGDPIKPKVHPDKRDKIMKLLQLDTRYWWIDIFCTQSDTPLVIMGDIYKNCTDCYALVDCPYEVFDRETVFPISSAAQISEHYLEEAAQGYLDIISKAHHMENEFVGWSQALSDFIHWPSNPSQWYQNSFSKYKKLLVD